MGDLLFHNKENIRYRKQEMNKRKTFPLFVCWLQRWLFVQIPGLCIGIRMIWSDREQYLEKGRMLSKISFWKKAEYGARSVLGKRSDPDPGQYLEKGRM